MPRATMKKPITVDFSAENMDGHNTPASAYSLIGVGKAAITRKPYAPGIYSWEFIHRKGHCLYWFIDKPLPVTYLKIDGHTWMVDDPLHWYGMKEYISHTQPGKPLLLAGLGLGLAVWHAVKTKASEIYVNEINQDVIALVAPFLPRDPRIHIICGDFYQEARHLGEMIGDGTVLWDLLVGDGDSVKFQREFAKGKGTLWLHFSTATRMIFGTREKSSLTF